jgi:hypothetical protein
MAVLTPPQTRSYPLVGFVNITFEDIVGAAAVSLMAVPVGSIFIAMSLNVTTAFAGGTTHDADFGDATDPNEYSTTIVELDGAAGLPANNCTVGTRFLTTASEPNLLITPTSTGGDPTSGAAYLYAEYIQNTKADENYNA